MAVAVALFGLLWGCQPVFEAAPRTGTAPTAVILGPDREYIGLLDGGANLEEWVCLKAPQPGELAIAMDIDTPRVEVEVRVVDGSGQALLTRRVVKGASALDIDLRTDGQRRCIVMAAAGETSVYRLYWRYR